MKKEIKESGQSSSRIGIVSAFGAEADILVERTVNAQTHHINGNRFTTGQLCGNDVVIVLCGVSMVNAAMVTQLMLDRFNVDRLVMSGIAGGLDPAFAVGDVLVPQEWAMPMEIYWGSDGKVPSPCGREGDLAPLGLELARASNGAPRPSFSVRTPEGELFETGQFLRDSFVLTETNAPQGEFRFSYPADDDMMAVARTLTPELLRVGPKDQTMSVSHQPKMVVGGVGVSCTAFVANPDYRAYLNQALGARVTDMETASFAHVAYANQVPYIAFRSLSDIAGGDHSADVGAFFASGLAEANASAVTLSFLSAWKQR
jgi:adenosylhomocysteine nucleosidase